MKIVFVVLIIVALGFLAIKYFLFKIGDPVNLKVSDSYFYHYRKKIIVYSPMGNWFELAYFESEADFKSFQPINRDFEKETVFDKHIDKSTKITTDKWKGYLPLFGHYNITQ